MYVQLLRIDINVLSRTKVLTFFQSQSYKTHPSLVRLLNSVWPSSDPKTSPPKRSMHRLHVPVSQAL
jgi:hypothetical protein